MNDGDVPKSAILGKHAVGHGLCKRVLQRRQSTTMSETRGLGKSSQVSNLEFQRGFFGPPILGAQSPFVTVGDPRRDRKGALPQTRCSSAFLMTSIIRCRLTLPSFLGVKRRSKCRICSRTDVNNSNDNNLTSVP